MGCVSDLDAKLCVADLDARRFCGEYTNPLVMMEVALYRYLPGRNAMIVNEAMYSLFYLWLDMLCQSILYQIFDLIVGHKLPIIDLAIVQHNAFIALSCVKIRYVVYADIEIILIRKSRFLRFK